MDRTCELSLDDYVLEIPKLLVQAREVDKRNECYGVHLTEFYPAKEVVGSKGQAFTRGYILYPESIMMLVYDETAHCHDIGETFSEELSDEAFLKKIKSGEVSAKEVYARLVEHINKPPLNIDRAAIKEASMSFF